MDESSAQGTRLGKTYLYRIAAICLALLYSANLEAKPIRVDPLDPLYNIWLVPKIKQPQGLGGKINELVEDVMDLRKQCWTHDEKKWCARLREDTIMFTLTIRFW